MYYITYFDIKSHILQIKKGCICPLFILTIDFFVQIALQILDFYTLLLHSVPITHGYTTICFGVKIHSNTVWCTYFVLSTVAFANTTSDIIFTTERTVLRVHVLATSCRRSSHE